MEGGAIGSNSGIRLADIGDFRKVDETMTVTQASLFSTLLVLLSARIGNVGGDSLNKLFDQFGLESVVGLVAILTILLQFGRYVYSMTYGGYGKPWSPFIFVCIIISVQLIHDAMYSYGILGIVPKGKNELIDAIRAYAYEAKRYAFAGHAVLIGATALIAMLLQDVGDLEKYIFIAITVYAIVYALSGVPRPQVPAAVIAPPPKKEPMGDMRGGRFY